MLRLVSRVSFVCVAVLAFGAGCGDDKGKMLPVLVIDGGTDGGGGATACGAVFLSPADTSTLTASDDKDDDSCKAGFQTDVELAVAGSANGTTATLYAAGVQVGTAVVSGGRLTFVNVQLAAQGSVALSVQVGTGATGCMATSTVMVDCNVPTCSITKPVLSDTHPILNSADRASAAGSDYQVAFEVATSLPDGRDVLLEVAQSTAPTVVTTITAKAMGGKATFAGVTLRPDGTFLAQAICTDVNGVKGSSAKGTYVVDTAAPTLDVTSPVDMKHFNPTDLMNGKFQVCAATTSADAAGLPVANMNLCAAIGTASPVCGGVTMAGAGGNGCVSLDCPGGAPFNLTVTLKDGAGNPTAKTVQAVTCASTLPSVQIVSPPGDATPFSDVAKHLLAANAGTAFVDADAVAAGAQATVVACTDKAGSSARLLAGPVGGAQTEIGASVKVVAAVAADKCANGFGFAARWTAAIPQSMQNAGGTLLAATRLVVEVIDISTAKGVSPGVDLWVDSVAPNLTQSASAPTCGRIIESATDTVSSVVLTTTSPTISLRVQGSSTSMTYTGPTITGAVATFSNVTFYAGSNLVTATATDPAGNSAKLPDACTVLVGQVPIVTWQNPGSGRNLCAAGNSAPECVADGDAAAGWQGSLTVSVTRAGSPATSGTVTFFANTVALGVAVNINGSGVATLPNVTIADGSVTIEARTSDLAGTGIGSSSKVVVVDTSTPTAATGLTPTILDRRATSFRLAWTAPDDGGAAVAGYQIRVSDTPITASNFAAATAVSYSGAPKAPGQAEQLDVPNRPIEKDQYFAVAAVDLAGNAGAIVTAGPLAARFNRTIIPAPAGALANERFGAHIDGSADLDGDTYSDILIGTVSGSNAYIIFGSANPDDMADPAKRRMTTLVGPGVLAYGRVFINAGDLDGDGRSDLAISSSRAGNGRVYILRGRTIWAASYNLDTESDFIIELDSSYANTQFGESMVQLGNFDGLGAADLAIAAPGYGATRGRVNVVFGGVSGLVTPAIGAVLPITLNASNLSMAIIDGEAAQTIGRFGDRLLGVSYTGGSSNTLLVAAPKATSRAGAVYAIQNLVASATPVTVGAPDATGVTGSDFGTSLALVGPIGAANSVAVAGPAQSSVGFGYVDVFFGSSGANLVAGSSKRFVNSGSTTAGSTFGRTLMGSGFSGLSISVNIVGDATADFVVSSALEGSAVPRVFVLDGSLLAGLGPYSDIAGGNAISLSLPTDWVQNTPYQRDGVLRDINQDGAADFAVGEYSVGAIVGRVAVFW